jgi:hypothetical protein
MFSLLEGNKIVRFIKVYLYGFVMTDSTKQEGKGNHLDSNMLESKYRMINVRPNKKRRISDDQSQIEKLAKKTIHNLQTCIVGPYPMNNSDLYISLRTDDSSYDLNGFYEQLTKHGYAIQ